MSRADELRAKFKAKGAAVKKEMDSPLGQFRSILNRFVAEVCNASSSNEFAMTMYDKWSSTKDEGIDTWLLKEIKPLFVSNGPAPRWRFEPSWCFLDGMPMMFVAQYDCDDLTYYIFKGRRKTDDGWAGVTKMTAQSDDYIVVLEGEIVG